MRPSILTLAFALPAIASAAPTLSGDDIAVVSADHAEWNGAAAQARGDVIEIPLKAGAASSHISFDDKTVKRIDVAIEGEPRLLVRLHHSKASTLRTLAALKIMNEGGAIRVSFPREIPHTPTPVPAEKTEPKVEPKINAATIDSAPAPKAEAPIVNADAKPLEVVAPVAAQPIAAFADEPKSSGSRIWSTMILLLCAAGIAIYAIMRKKNAPAQKGEEPFRIVATRTLGPKSKLFMVEVEDKKLLFAVDDKGTRLVQSFDKARAEDGAKSELPTDMSSMFEDEMSDTQQRTESPAIAGLLRLRKVHGLDFIAPEGRVRVAGSDLDAVESGDEHADNDWAEMLMRATNRRGQS